MSEIEIVCIDDEKEILEIFSSIITKLGFKAVSFTNAEEAVRYLNHNTTNIALVICDYKMESKTGLDIRKETLEHASDLPFLIVSSYVTKEIALAALDLKIETFIDKPISSEDLVKVIQQYSAKRVEHIIEIQELEEVFVEEVADILDEMEEVLISMDKDRTNIDKINLMFRFAHTIKGSCGILSTDVVNRYVHKYEDIISDIKKGSLHFSDHVYEVLLKGYDRIKQIIASIPAKKLSHFNIDEIIRDLDLNIQENQASSDAFINTFSKEPEGSLQKSKESISVPIDLLETLSSSSGEITVLRNMVNKIVKSLERQYAGNKDIQGLSELLDEMHKINASIQNQITDLRKVPLSSVLKTIPRIVRDLGRDLNKEINLEIIGEKLRVDNTIASVFSASLVHLVRNSADHGLEKTQKRLELGKPKAGSIKIECKQVDEEVQVRITDDGQGIDPNKIRQRALEKGLYTESQLASMSTQRILDIIFAAGFSTSESVSKVSGRGVGMDMVRASVEAIGGQITIDSIIGQGTTFTLHLPIPKSVMIITSLIIESRKKLFAIPQDVIQRILKIDAQESLHAIKNVASGRTIQYEEKIYPLLNLSELLHLKEDTSTPYTSCSDILLIDTEDFSYALEVDGVHDAEEIVVKRIDSHFNPNSVFSGATFLDDGSVGLIIDPKGFALLAGLHENQIIPSTNTTEPDTDQSRTALNILLFSLGTQATFGVPLEQIFRLEEFSPSAIQLSGEQNVILYRNQIMPLHSTQKLFKLAENPIKQDLKTRINIPTIVVKNSKGYTGLHVDKVVDIARTYTEISPDIRDREGIIGNIRISGRNVTIVDLENITRNVIG